MEEPQAPPAPAVPTRSLPELLDPSSDATPLPSPNPPPSRSPSPPVAGPSKSAPKRLRWSDDESGVESDEFTPQTRKAIRPSKRLKVGSLKRAGTKLEGKGAKCDLCGKRLGRATDLPRHKASCKENPERATRKTPCEFCEKLLPGTLLPCSVKVPLITRATPQSAWMPSSAIGHPRLVFLNERRVMMMTRTCRNHSRRSGAPVPPCITFAKIRGLVFRF